MEWIKNLYVTESIGDKAGKIKEKVLKIRIKKRILLPDVYLIALPLEGNNLLEIVPALNLKQKAYPDSNLCIIGLAKGQNQAYELVREIIQEVYDKRHDVDIRSYIKEKERI